MLQQASIPLVVSSVRSVHSHRRWRRFSQLCTARSFEGRGLWIWRRMKFSGSIYQSPAGGQYDSRFRHTYVAVRRDCSVPVCAFLTAAPRITLFCVDFLVLSSESTTFSSHPHNVLRCPWGLLRLPTHGLDIIETSGRTPINRDKAKPRKKKKKKAAAGTNGRRRPLCEREEERDLPSVVVDWVRLGTMDAFVKAWRTRDMLQYRKSCLTNTVITA